MTIEEQLFLNTESFDSSGSHRLFLSKRCICSALIVDLPGNLLRLLITGFLSTLSHFVFILGFQATTVDVQVFESALGLGLKMYRTQPVVFFGVPGQN